MRRELEDVVEHTSAGANSQGKGARGGGELPDPNSFSVSGGGGPGDEGDDEDPYGEFERQQQLEIMQEQDEQLDGVFRTVGNLRMQAEDIGRELEEQVGMIDEIDTLADRVGGKLQTGVKKVGYIIKRNEGMWPDAGKEKPLSLIVFVTDTVSSCCIAVLIFVLILLLILVIVL